MSSRGAALWVLVFVVLAVVGGGIELLSDGTSTRDEGAVLASSARIVRVIDGDTVRVRSQGRTETVRYIGVDTPETVKPGTAVECFGKRASAFNRRLVTGRRVRLRFGRERRDRYGRLLAYVYVAGRGRRSVNSTLVARGYGTVLTIPPNTEHTAPFERLERRARRRGLGIWRACAVR
jgi:micrococcal nuclease